MALLLLLGVVALLLEEGGSGSSSPHSLRYFYTALSEPGQGLRQFSIMGYVDGRVFVKYDSHNRKMLPQVPWMEEFGKKDPEYWEGQSTLSQDAESVFRVDLQTLRDRYHQKNSTGLHTWQLMYGCEVWPDGRFRGGQMQYAYDGEDFLALDRETLTWTARVPQAQLTKTRWETKLQNAPRLSSYLENECVEWLWRYLNYSSESLQRTEAPTVSVARKKYYDGRETLVCRLHGFYPKEIDVTWRKGGEFWHQDTYTGGVVPNSDGTYHTWLSIEVDPKERGRYQCCVEHDGLLEPLDLAWEDPASGSYLILILLILTGIMAAPILVVFGVTFYMRKQKKKIFKGVLSESCPFCSGMLQRQSLKAAHNRLSLPLPTTDTL